MTELDLLLQDHRLTPDEWKTLHEVLKMTYPSFNTPSERRTAINKNLRHAWGHSVLNLGREWYQPDYRDILEGTAKKLSVPVKNHHSVPELERNIIAEVIDQAKARIIKEKGREEWDRMEQEIRKKIDESIAKGEIPQAVASQLQGLGPGMMAAALIGGRIAGFGLYIVANQVFFAISRTLGLGVGVAVAGPIIGGALSFLLGPFGWLFAGGWLIYDLGGTNWSKVIPAVVVVGCIRARLS